MIDEKNGSLTNDQQFCHKKGSLPQNPGVASFPQTNTTGFNDFPYLGNNWWPKNEKIKMAESKAENSNLNKQQKTFPTEKLKSGLNSHIEMDPTSGCKTSPD